MSVWWAAGLLKSVSYGRREIFAHLLKRWLRLSVVTPAWGATAEVCSVVTDRPKESRRVSTGAECCSSASRSVNITCLLCQHIDPHQRCSCLKMTFILCLFLLQGCPLVSRRSWRPAPTPPAGPMASYGVSPSQDSARCRSGAHGRQRSTRRLTFFKTENLKKYSVNSAACSQRWDYPFFSLRFSAQKSFHKFCAISPINKSKRSAHMGHGHYDFWYFSN